MLPRVLAVLATIALAGSPLCASDSFNRTIRVGLQYGAGAPQSVVISGVGRARGERATVTFCGDVAITARDGELMVGCEGESVGAGSWVELTPTGRDPWLEMGQGTYRGTLRLEACGPTQLRVIGVLDIEDYVRGVVPNEMFPHPEAYRGQAVVSRTYALYVRDLERKHEADGFDICATGHCQVYRGVDSERPLADEAVEATAGQILTYQGSPIFSAYHSNAGGVTQPVDEAWPGSIRERFPYLCQVDSPYDSVAAGLNGYSWCYRWRKELTRTQLAQLLRARGKDVGEVQDLVITGLTSTGRATGIEVVGSAGRAQVRGPTQVREFLGTPSERFTIERTPSGFSLSGRGHGHGVGLSQHGALGMAKAGYRYPEILGHFYRGVALTEGYGAGQSRPLPAPVLGAPPAEVLPAPVPAGAS